MFYLFCKICLPNLDESEDTLVCENYFNDESKLGFDLLLVCFAIIIFIIKML